MSWMPPLSKGDLGTEEAPSEGEKSTSGEEAIDSLLDPMAQAT